MAGETVLVIDDSPTILKVVQLVLTKAGFEVITAEDGDEGLELAQEHEPDLILLDFVMPKVNGYQVCRSLHQEETLKEIPVILMSAKGDQVGERFVKVMGIVDYITKPFSPEALTGLVQHTVDKYVDEGVQPHSQEDQPELDVDIALPPEEAREAAEAAIVARGAALDDFRSGLSQLAGKAAAMGAADRGEALDDEQLAEWIASGLTDDKLGLLLGELRAAAPELLGEPDVALAGELKAVPLAEVLLLLAQQEQQGVLVIARRNAEVELHFRAGRVEQGTATGAPEELLLGRFIVDAEHITEKQLDEFIDARERPIKLLGTQLVKAGLITEEELKGCLGQQTREHIYEALRWNYGRFSFRTTEELAPLALEASLGLDVEAILMEGFRRVDEWHLIEREIDDFDTVFVRNEDAVARMGRGRLTREELAVLELVTGKNTIKEITRQSRMGSFEVSKMLYRLLSIKLIRKRVQPMAV
jgi:CheY-like chemotaxis protein